MIGYGPDPIRVGDRRPSELLHQETHGRQGYRRPWRTLDGFRRPVHSAAVPPADKRQRKKDNARAAREAREAEVKKRKRNRTLRNAGIAVAVFVVAFLLLNLLNHKDKKKVVASPTTSTTSTVLPASATATIKTNLGTIVLALDTKNDPKGAGRFIALAKAGTYNGSRWHRIVKDFVIQGGAPGGDPNKSVGNAVVGELPKDHYPVGSVAAAKTQSDPPGTFDAQFFIVTGAAQGASLPNDYARFGTVKSGMDVVKKIEALPVDANSSPTSKATIDTVTITGK
jgi:peptidyl-prolyl cis-trans isomerase B (cyclophilin B)